MKEYTIKTERKAEGDIEYLAVYLSGSDEGISFETMVRWLATIDWLTKQVKLSEYRCQDGVEHPTDELQYKESAFVGWELLDQSIAIPLMLKQRISGELGIL